MKIVIDGDPIALKRHRSGIVNRKIRCYDSQKEIKSWIRHKFEMAMHEAYESKNKEIQLMASSLALNRSFNLTLTFYMPIGDSLSLAQKNAKLWGFELYNQKPDIDNLIKFYLDCANEILFADDAMIVEIKAEKKWSSNPRTEIEIMPKKPISLKEKHMEILKIFGPDLIQEMYEEIFRMHKNDACFQFHNMGPDKELLLRQTAEFLEKFAEKFAKPLSKVTKL